jgi:uncharacterized protein (DUF2126 family)/transglutaminase-like putative cysteine protease
LLKTVAMSIHVGLTHVTRYKYDRPVTLSPHVVRLRPAPHCRTPVKSYSLRITPEQHFINWQQDPFGNYQARLVFPEQTRELAIEVDLVADMTVINPFDFFLDDAAEHYPFTYDSQVRKELTPYLETEPVGPLLNEWLAGVDRSRKRTVPFLVSINTRLQNDIRYLIRMEPGVQPCEETLRKRNGSCRDTAWLLVQILRNLGLAARFVSGYLVQLTPDVKSLDGPTGPVYDFTDLHAWTEVYIPGAGWVGLDPTSGLFAGEGHIPLACTPEPSTAAPITGAVDKCEVSFEFHNAVQRVREEPRVTRPYSDEQWASILAVGEVVHQESVASDVRLTTGGEPTFVSIDNVDAPEWNTTALGPHKRRLADQLLRRLRDRFGPGAVLHHGQGKWYPGEELPRWSFSAIWRRDGVPVWREPSLIADAGASYGHGLSVAGRFLRELARRLGVDPDCTHTAYEDVYYYLWREGTLPVNVDPLKSNLKDGLERARIARLLERGLEKPTGYALPLRWGWVNGHEGWQSGRWEFRRGRMYLVPGDSPMGYRLPLDSLPWLPPSDRDPHAEVSTFDSLGPLGRYFDPEGRPRLQEQSLDPVLQSVLDRRDSAGDNRMKDNRLGDKRMNDERMRDNGVAANRPIDPTTAAASNDPFPDPDPDPFHDPETDAHFDFNRQLPSGSMRTALCVEPRDGRLHVFLPPVASAEHFLDLVARIEDTSAALHVPVLIEGYPPPADPRLNRLAVTPDPGVIEVNMPPVSSWAEAVSSTELLYEEARLTRLTAEKFLLDGRHTGTGGGNHITLGGRTPGDSPLLRRPQLLQSLITYWQHHPSLSYLFSTLFIGPTSQMPRIDEARNDALYELEIAFQQMPAGQPPFPWVVDRLLRHLLVDLTGNTHRAEFCIDKLFSPDSLAGRQGLLEMRGFEMPPHARMSVVQQLLVRALLQRFWKEPYVHPLVRWGTQLHDRWMLPHHAWVDIREVVEDLRRHGFEFEAGWFAPFLEFRFPKYGQVQIGDVSLELRMALEPWHVLGEEVSAGGTSRYVDSSVERLQVRAFGATDSRHVVLCNGRRVPMRPTGVPGESVAGVRYRAWQPPSCLHPLIPVHTPLVFDLYDAWNGRSLGGCTYHVGHPGGRNFEHFPVNAYEAESRRLARFWPHGHTPGAVPAPAVEHNPTMSHTLDLRYHG